MKVEHIIDLVKVKIMSEFDNFERILIFCLGIFAITPIIILVLSVLTTVSIVILIPAVTIISTLILLKRIRRFKLRVNKFLTRTVTNWSELTDSLSQVLEKIPHSDTSITYSIITNLSSPSLKSRVIKALLDVSENDFISKLVLQDLKGQIDNTGIRLGFNLYMIDKFLRNLCFRLIRKWIKIIELALCISIISFPLIFMELKFLDTTIPTSLLALTQLILFTTGVIVISRLYREFSENLRSLKVSLTYLTVILILGFFMDLMIT
ncbi:MAG: hypothetical protein B6V02_00310 [Thermoprotei archaeon ex4572_64]|nr:MAG: hypothetical protein B6V02_00310 [Thermoprotei archaeon ex4572_64]